MRRRKFIALLGGIAVATPWQRTARAQQPNEMRHIAVLASGNADVQVFKAGLAAFHERLRQLGWKDGQNVRIDLRPGKGDFDNIRKLASELAGLAPAVIVTVGGSAVGLCCRRPVPCRSCLCSCPTRSVLASSVVCRDRAATQPALWRSNTV